MARNPYIPAFNRYPPAILQAFGRIEHARGAIEAAQILPAQEEILRKDALAGSIHYSNVIEGNDLPRIEALRAVEHELRPDDRAKLELVNYVSALDHIAAKHRENGITYTPDFLKTLHGILTKGLGRVGTRFQPHHEGEWRDGGVTVEDAFNVYHVAPPALEVDDLMRARLEWLESKRASDDYPTPIIAGVAHFEVAEVHPFADYNGRTARLFATAVLWREAFLERPLFSPERYYAEDKDAYYEALRAIKRTHNLTDWLTYYVTGLAVEFERVAERIRHLNELTRALDLPVQLTANQEEAIAALTTGGRRELTIVEYVDMVGASPRSASRDLNALVEAGVLRARGTTRDRRFVLAATQRGTGGRPRSWSDERIRSQLEELTVRLGRSPTYGDFEEAGLLPLYAAVMRTGGIEHWAAELGSFVPDNAGVRERS
jgi:cell filamentation protein, protein adenylyltransferase